MGVGTFEEKAHDHGEEEGTIWGTSVQLYAISLGNDMERAWPRPCPPH